MVQWQEQVGFLWHFRGRSFQFALLILDFGILQVIELTVVSLRQRFSILAAHGTALWADF